MAKGIRCVCYDAALRVEAYTFSGVMQEFPNHFHEYYVIGFIESGKRRMNCRNVEYALEAGDLLLLNPRDSHTCEAVDHNLLDYRCINIAPDVMEQSMREITGRAFLPRLGPTVLCRSELVPPLRALHTSVMREEGGIAKEELFYFLIEQLVADCCGSNLEDEDETGDARVVCDYLESHYSDGVTLDELGALTGWNKYNLLRRFTRQMGITPYRYLQTIRVERAKKLLETGATPLEAAMSAGFADQSHFSNCFKEFIGLTPRQYRRIFAAGEQTDKKDE